LKTIIFAQTFLLSPPHIPYFPAPSTPLPALLITDDRRNITPFASFSFALRQTLRFFPSSFLPHQLLFLASLHVQSNSYSEFSLSCIVPFFAHVTSFPYCSFLSHTLAGQAACFFFFLLRRPLAGGSFFCPTFVLPCLCSSYKCNCPTRARRESYIVTLQSFVLLFFSYYFGVVFKSQELLEIYALFCCIPVNCLSLSVSLRAVFFL